MSASIPQWNRGAVRPMEALRAGWDLIKGQYWLFLGIALVGIMIGNALPLGILMGPMMCGIYIALFRRQRGETVTFEMLFKGFDYFKESLIATLIHIVPVLIVLLPTYIIFFALFYTSMKPARRGAPPTDMAPFFAFIIIFVVAVMILSLIIGAFFIFTYPLIIDRRLSGVDAVKTSIRAAAANLGGIFGLLLLTTLLGIVGVLICYVGAILVMPVSFAAWSIAYRQVFPDVGTVYGKEAPLPPPPPPATY